MARTRTKAALRKRGRASPPPKEKLEFVQDFIPLKELKNGIVETTDGRFIKILEIEPINFLLRSDEEQWGIISTFASWLKISPMRLQFKSVTRKADSDQYVAGLQADLEQETVEACRRLGEGTIQFIREEGSREALSRRFFLIFQYEAAMKAKRNTTAGIIQRLNEEADTARRYLDGCELEVLEPSFTDDFILKLLYEIINKRTSRRVQLPEGVFDMTTAVHGVFEE